MNENERTIEPGFNPYDHLMEPVTEPVKSPVILGNAREPEKSVMIEKPMEIIPLAGEAIYKKISLSECEKVDFITFEVDEDVLVPDTFPDMEIILNMDAAAGDIEIYSESGVTEIKGNINLEVMYKSAETYGNNISVLPAELNFSKEVRYEGPLLIKVRIINTEYRIINERKYKAKVHIAVDIEKEVETEKMLFEGIEGETLYLNKENVKMLDLISRKTKESDITEELIINDDRIRPVKVLKSKAVVSENHRQLTKEKLILNQTIWVRIMYLAEITSKGNLSNQVMFFQSKIDHTQFISLSSNESEAVTCITYPDIKNIKVEINREGNGFEISGDLTTEVAYYGCVDNAVVTDFYHEKEEMTCDRKVEKICKNINCLSIEQTIRESINLQQDVGDELRIIYMDAHTVDVSTNLENNTIYVRGKLHLEAVVMNEGDYTILAKKICEFSCMKELPQEYDENIELIQVLVREIKCDISGKNVNVTVQLQANVNMYDEKELNVISNPCIIRSGEPEKHYPITIHTVAEGETVWEIGKKYKVNSEQIIHYNKEEDIKPGKKIIIVK